MNQEVSPICQIFDQPAFSIYIFIEEPKGLAMEPWAQYQSVLQLAAGTNIAITGLLSVYGSEFGREERRLVALEKSASEFRSKLSDSIIEDKELKDKFSSLLTKSKNLRAKSTNEEVKSQPIVLWGTIICLAAGVASLILLFLSSYQPEIQSSLSFIISLVLAFPPFAIVLAAALNYLLVTRRIHLDRERIQNDLFVEAGIWLAKRTAGGKNGAAK